MLRHWCHQRRHVRLRRFSTRSDLSFSRPLLYLTLLLWQSIQSGKSVRWIITDWGDCRLVSCWPFTDHPPSSIQMPHPSILSTIGCLPLYIWKSWEEILVYALQCHSRWQPEKVFLSLSWTSSLFRMCWHQDNLSQLVPAVSPGQSFQQEEVWLQEACL